MRASLVGWMMLAGLATGCAEAELKVPAIFSDHMVLEAGGPVPVWGIGSPGAEITVRLLPQELHGRADAQGYWKVTLEPLRASDKASEMRITEKGGSEIVIHDVLVGEVWVGAGQSNMGFALNAMEGREKVIARAGNPQLRLFTVKHKTAPEPVGMHPGEAIGDVEGRWEIADPQSAANFSAVAYLFGEELQAALKRPVGMISDNWGGTPIKTWMSLEAFASDAAFEKYVAEYKQAIVTHERVSANPQNQSNYVAADKLWHQQIGDKLDADNKRWEAALRAGQDAGPKPKPSRPEPENPDPTGIPLGGYRPQSPGISWNGMFAPIVPYAVKGVLWYQGEANVSGYREYGEMLHALVAEWRRAWAEPTLDFLVVQLPGDGEDGGATRNLAHMREVQAGILDTPHTGLAITYDVGDPGNVHPASKIDVAHRLTLIARGKVYGERVAYTGPVMESARVEGATMRLHFTGIGGKLVIGQAPWVAGDAKQFPADRLVGFEVAGADHVYKTATAMIDGDNVVVAAEGVSAPKFVRYAFDETPWANLYDSSGLPAAPFRTDKTEKGK